MCVLLSSWGIDVGWAAYIKSDRDITEESIDSIILALPEALQGWYPGKAASKQPWGWSSAVDISLEGKQLTISGAYGISGHKARSAAKHFRKELLKLGHKLKRTKYNW